LITICASRCVHCHFRLNKGYRQAVLYEKKQGRRGRPSHSSGVVQTGFSHGRGGGRSRRLSRILGSGRLFAAASSRFSASCRCCSDVHRFRGECRVSPQMVKTVVVLAWVKCANQKWWKNVGALSIQNFSVSVSVAYKRGQKDSNYVVEQFGNWGLCFVKNWVFEALNERSL
jgi:hypothetical protein